LDYVLDHVIHRPLTDIGAVRYLPFHYSSRSRGESAKDVEREMGIAGALNLIIEYVALGERCQDVGADRQLTIAWWITRCGYPRPMWPKIHSEARHVDRKPNPEEM
jgi:hypothetical protein